jgi:hypothetical protein
MRLRELTKKATRNPCDERGIGTLSLVLHWNPRQMQLRGVEARNLTAAGKCLVWEGSVT